MPAKEDEKREEFYNGMLLYMESLCSHLIEIRNELQKMNARLAERK